MAPVVHWLEEWKMIWQKRFDQLENILLKLKKYKK
jgi:hypothetical protein